VVGGSKWKLILETKKAFTIKKGPPGVLQEGRISSQNLDEKEKKAVGGAIGRLKEEGGGSITKSYHRES